MVGKYERASIRADIHIAFERNVGTADTRGFQLKMKVQCLHVPLPLDRADQYHRLAASFLTYGYLP